MKTDEFNSPANIFFRRIAENLDTDGKLSTPEEGTALSEIWRQFVTTLDIDDWELAGEADPEAKRKIIGNTFIDVFEVIGHMHMSEAVFAYVPESRVLMQGEVLTS